ncbi:unnamed protein product [Lactuca saligna]|uniref:AP-5 complex subunit beta-1 n=1 Tax=Lactuca saligna TaxID=75948 RepID=A0AA35YD97_LACSI|nr:unnamed protein product [Lactuca saligna]
MLTFLWMLLTKLCKFLHKKAFSTMEAATHKLIHPTVDALLSMLATVKYFNNEQFEADEHDKYLKNINVPSQFMRNLIDDNSSSELLEGTQIEDLYDLLEIKLVDFQWGSNGPLLEIIMGSLLFHGIITANVMEGSVDSELQVNYNNIHKVLWEPFLEPWKFQVSLRREQGKSALQNSPVMTDVHLESTMNLNINVTESLIEVILTNAKTIPFEVRFDIPFGVSPKILDPVYQGHEFPLPLHFAESGRIRWRPLGNTYLWSEAYSISNILSNERSRNEIITNNNR